MAKRKVNKAAAIREYAGANPNEGPTAVVKALAEKGIKVTPQQVSTTLNNDRKTSGAKVKRQGRKAATPKVRLAKSDNLAVEDLIKAKKLADQFGGIAKAKAALDALSRIID